MTRRAVLSALVPQMAAQRSRAATQTQSVAELRQQLGEQAEKLAAQDLVIADLASKLARLEERLRAHTGEPADDDPTGERGEPRQGDAKQRKRPARAAADPTAATAAKRTKKT